MGISIEAHRARIGLFNLPSRSSGGGVLSQKEGHFGSSWLAAIVIVILLLMAGVEPNPGPGEFVCTYCNMSFSTTLQYVKHLMVHSHWKNFSILCCFCGRKFKSAESLESHITRFHQEVRVKRVTLAKFSCPVDLCKEEMSSRAEFMQHMIEHLKENVEFVCSQDGCKSKINAKRQFQNHMSRSHPVSSNNDANQASAGPSEPLTEPSYQNERRGNIEESVSMDVCDDVCEEVEDEDPYLEHIIKDDIARFYLKLEGELLLATNTVQEISQEVKRLTEYSHHCLKKSLQKQLSALELPDNVIKSIVNTTFNADPVFNVHHKDNDIECLCSDYLRNIYWSKKFPFINPQEIYFGKNDAGKKRVAQYISIRKTLEVLMRDKEVKKMVLQSFEKEGNTRSILEDFSDGSGYAAHKCQHVDGKCLQLLLFEDAFDFTAFGPSAGVHKPLGFYWSLGNIPPEYRTNLDLIMLAYMILDKDTQPTMQEELEGRNMLKETLAPLLDELKLLKTEGILIDGEKVPVCLLYLIGDNLGQHTVGSFVRNFSAEFFCRFCDMSKTQFRNKPFEVNPFRTPEEYNEAVKLARILYERRKKEAIKAAKKTQLRKEGKRFGNAPRTVTKTVLPKSSFKKVCAVNYKA